jgi:hypothetical protein
LYAKCLPIGDTQSRVVRGEEDKNLAKIIDALEAAIEDRNERFGPAGRSFRDTSLHETIALCRGRLEHLEAGNVR